MGSSTPRHAELYQELANAAWEITAARAVVLGRLDRASMLVSTLALAPTGAAVPREAAGALKTAVRADANRRLRHVYVEGREVSASPRALLDTRSRREPAGDGWVTILPIETRRGIAGSLTLFARGRPAPLQRRRYRAAARLASLIFDLSDDVREYIRDDERVRKEAASLLHGTHAALIAIRHRLGESRKLLAADPTHADAVLENARGELERIGERDIGRMSRRLFPLVIRMSLAPALEALADLCGPNVKIVLSIEKAIARLDDPLDNRLPEAVRLAVYRVAEAAVIRAAAGSPAPRLEISLSRSGGPALILRVRDVSNRPANSAQRQPYPGDLLLRVHDAGGTLRVSSRRGGGISWSASFPLPGEDEAARSATPRSPV
jgi:hypothetical protein